MEKKKAHITRYIFIATFVLLLGIAIALFTGLLFPDWRSMGVTLGVIMLLASIGAGTRAFRTHTQVQEREVYLLRKDLQSQVDATAAQQERNRLARDLHDSIKQQLFSIQMSAAATQARWDDDPAGAQTALADVRQSAHEALTEMNALLQQLSPAPLEKVGLVQALRDQAEALGYRTGAEVTVDIGDLPGDDAFPPGAQQALFRIAQEALSNIARHARATRVTLVLAERDNTLHLDIHDDGQGFDPSAKPAGMGLTNIRQRVTALDSTLDVQSAPDAGTTLHIAVPLTAPLEESSQSDSSVTKALLTGALGGLGLIALLFYPLYVELPGYFVPDWLTSTSWISLLCCALAVGGIVGVGTLAARWAGATTRLRGAIYGALSGSVAGLFLYMWLASTASAVPALAWLQEPYPPMLSSLVNESDFYEIVSFAATALSSLSTYGTFGLTLVLGSGLAALGGNLSTRQDTQTPVESISHSPTVKLGITTGTIFSMLLVWFTITVIHSLWAEQALSNTIPLEITGLRLSAHHLYLLPICTSLLIYIAFATGQYFLLKDNISKRSHNALGHAQVQVVVQGGYAIGIVLYALFIVASLLKIQTVWRGIFGGLLIACMGVGVAYWNTLSEIKTRWQAHGLGQTHIAHLMSVIYTPTLILAIISLYLTRPFDVHWVQIVILILIDTILIARGQRPAMPLFDRRKRRSNPHITVSKNLGIVFASLFTLVPHLAMLVNNLYLLFSASQVVRQQLGLAESRSLAYTLSEVVQQVFYYKIWLFGGILISSIAIIELSTFVLDGIMALWQLKKHP